MNGNLPSVTVLIAARPEQADIKAVTAAQSLDYPSDKLEILVARGKQPSAQRNAALKAAHGELIYFLDDDSVPRPDNLLRAAPLFSRPEVKMVGGPNLCPPDAPELEQVFALVLASWALASSRARYTPVGKTRETSEKELILCNLVARREDMLELGGFDESLYPNEENALMDQLQKQGGKLLYDPEFIVLRRPRSSLKSFAKMLMTYGRGRAEQFRVNPTPGSALNFVPPLFVIYLLALVGMLSFLPRFGWLPLVPLAVYLVAVVGQAALLARVRSPKSKVGTRMMRSVFAIPLIVLTHVLYGLGFWRGLFTTLNPPGQGTPPPVMLERPVR
ncbi:MAG TPA: glycosyltransferase [Candidatus Binatia bacterium]|nr:glycosyltransferase [Candidatus Binatia bacterium]